MLTQIDVGVRLRDQLEKQLELHKAIAGIIKEGITCPPDPPVEINIFFTNYLPFF